MTVGERVNVKADWYRSIRRPVSRAVLNCPKSRTLPDALENDPENAIRINDWSTPFRHNPTDARKPRCDPAI